MTKWYVKVQFEPVDVFSGFRYDWKCYDGEDEVDACEQAMDDGYEVVDIKHWEEVHCE